MPRYYWLAAALRILAPALIRRATAGGGLTTDQADQPPGLTRRTGGYNYTSVVN